MHQAVNNGKERSVASSAPSRILHFAPGFRLGGIESLLMSLYRSLDKSKLQFDFMVDTCENLPEFDEIRAAGGRVFQMGRYVTAPISYQKKIEEIFQKYGNEYIAVHSHTVIRALPVLWGARRHGIAQRILHSHTESLEGSRWATVGPVIAKITALFATDYIACSKPAGRFVYGQRPFTVLNNTIPTQRFAFSREGRTKVRELLNIDADSLVVGHTGRFTYPKNHDWLIRVFAELCQHKPNARLLLVGEGPLKAEIYELVEQLGIKDNVVFAGLQSDIVSYLSAMDIFMLPSHYEGFSISLLEAQANGLPCLVSDVMVDEIKLTPSVITCSLNSKLSDWENLVIKLGKVDRAEGELISRENITLITQAGHDTDEQLDSLISLYFH